MSDKEDLSQECQDDIRGVWEFLESDDCKRYSHQRISNSLGDIEAAMEKGASIMKEHGRELYRDLIDSLNSDKMS